MHILSNNIGTEQASQLIKIMANKPKLKTLCGFSGNETELDLSYKRLSTGCGVLVGNEVKNNGALTSLNLAENSLKAEGAKHVATAIKGNVSVLRLVPF